MAPMLMTFHGWITRLRIGRPGGVGHVRPITNDYSGTVRYRGANQPHLDLPALPPLSRA
jgi:hypothetical protein